MDRPPRRSALKVQNFRHYHLSGDLEEVVQGKVSEAVNRWEDTCVSGTYLDTMDEETQHADLQAQVKEQKDKSARMQLEVQNMKLQNELEAEQLQQEQWEAAMKDLKEAKEKMLEEHQRNMDQMMAMATDSVNTQAVTWLQEQLTAHSQPNPDTRKAEAERQKAALLQDLERQQLDIQRQIADITGKPQASRDTVEPTSGEDSQRMLLEQIRNALSGKEGDKDPNKALLRALVTGQNKATGLGGTSTLRAEVLDKLTGGNEFSMVEWLASLNRQEEGELDVSKFLNRDDDLDCRQECRHTKMKSGMLDKSTTNIQCKEVWPQKNLGEDWAEEEMEFKQLKFEHLVAGETRTIETCTEPAEILGRLHLLRRIAYLKLRGIDWQLLRKMYAAILSSIETREYSWESNFDRFESILYRRVLTDRGQEKDHREHRSAEGKKRFCRDFNKPEGCNKSSPHQVWFGTGPSAYKKLVYHYCAACLIRDKVARDHPEGHQDCPHKA